MSYRSYNLYDIYLITKRLPADYGILNSKLRKAQQDTTESYTDHDVKEQQETRVNANHNYFGRTRKARHSTMGSKF